MMLRGWCHQRMNHASGGLELRQGRDRGGVTVAYGHAYKISRGQRALTRSRLVLECRPSGALLIALGIGTTSLHQVVPIGASRPFTPPSHHSSLLTLRPHCAH